MTQNPLLSVIIPTKNGEQTIGKALEAIFEQKDIDFEVIVIDSGSEDRTLEIVERYPVRIYTIPAEEFSHSRTRNLAVRLARGKYVFMTVQDAVIGEEDFFVRGLSYFDDEQVVAVVAKQVVPHHFDKNPLQWYRPVNREVVRRVQFRPEEFKQLSLSERFFYVRVDDVCTFYRRSVLLEVPFPDVDYGEDIFWANEVLALGYAIVFDENLKVFHYHHYDDKEKFFKRLENDFQVFEYFGVKPECKSTFKSLLRIIYLTYFRKNFVPRDKFYWLIYNLRLWLWRRRFERGRCRE